MNRKPKQVQVPLPLEPKADMDPLVQALWNKTEAEFLAMFEEPSLPD